MKATLGLAVAAVVVAGLLSGCAPTVSLTPAAADATSPKCASVVVLLPQTVSTLGQRQTDTQGTGAWGTPADILLRCGVPVPDPTSSLPCVTVDGIDWLRKPDPHNVFVFTTYGRDPAVAVTINSNDVKADGNQALSDLAIAVASIPAKHRCVAPTEVLQDGEPVNPPSTPTPALPTPKPALPTAAPTP
jgi:Protein of unknown function (DUF3515)